SGPTTTPGCSDSASRWRRRPGRERSSSPPPVVTRPRSPPDPPAGLSATMALGPLADHPGSAAGEAVTYGPEAVVIPGLLAGDDERVCQGSRPSWLLAGAASYQLALHRHRDRMGRVGRGATTAPPPVVPPVEAPSQHRPGPARGAPG